MVIALLRIDQQYAVIILVLHGGDGSPALVTDDFPEIGELIIENLSPSHSRSLR